MQGPMMSMGFRNYLKSISLGNLSTIDGNSIDADDSPLQTHFPSRADKQNLSSINDQKRELILRLKDLTIINHQSYDNGCDMKFPHFLPERNFSMLQSSVSRETYQQQSAMWELLVTEQNFLKQIKFVVEVYIAAFEGLTKDFFPKISSTDIFSNLKDVYKVSLEFWKECMQPLILHSHTYLNSHLLKNGFTKIGVILEPYILYCTEISTCRSYILALEKGNELFSEYIKWAMECEESNREMLCDHLAKPFQRLTKYKILLQAIQKYSSSEERTDIQEMIEAVDVFVTRVNEKVEEKTLSRKLLHFSNQIDSYDVLDPIGDDLLPIINLYNKFDVTAPILVGKRKIIRQLTHQGELKLREGPSKTIDIKMCLLTDILLVTKSKKKTLGKMKIIKPPIHLDKARFHKMNNNAFACICLNEFNCISALYHLSCGDSKKVDEWLQKLEEAVKHYSHLKPLETERSLSKDLQNLIPRVKVVQSSPKRNRFKSQSSNDTIESDNTIERSFTRKSPVTRKHKNKKDSVLYGIDVAFESPPLERKNSQPTLNTVEYEEIRRLSKSNSVHEINKQIDKQVSYNSDVDDTDSTSKIIPNPSSLNQFDSGYPTHIGKNSKFFIIEYKNEMTTRYNTDPDIKTVDPLSKSFSKSLNKLSS